jgi:spermidine synthase
VSISELDGVRYLHLGSVWVQGAMRIGAPRVVELDYVQRMLAALLWLPPERLIGSGRAVQLGLGAGALTRFTARELRMPTTAVEINPMVVAANTAMFHLPRSAEVVVGDAAAWLAQADPGSVRLLHVDLYDEEAAAPVLDSAAFYAGCRAVLEDGGVMAVNLFGRDASYAASVERIAAAFGRPCMCRLRPTREGNTVVVATRGSPLPARDVLRERAAWVEERFGRLGLPARKWLRMLQPLDGAAA